MKNFSRWFWPIPSVRAGKCYDSYLFGLSSFGSLASIFLYWKDTLFQYQWLILLLWLTSVSVLLLGFLLVNRFPKLKNSEITILLAIFIFSFFLRAWKISEIPILGHDEARDAGLLPQMFLRGEIKDFFGYNVYGIPNTFIILASAPHLIFGRTILSVRLLAVIFGSLSVILTYFLAKRFFNQKIGLIASLIMASYHIHLHFSRSEFLNVFDSFWACLVVWLLLISLEGEVYLYSLFGLFLGFSLHFYQGIRAVVFFAGIYFLAYSLRKTAFFSIKKLLCSAIGFLVGLGPTLFVALARPHQFLDTGMAGKSFLDFYKEGGVDGLVDFLTLLPNKFFNSLAAIVAKPIDFHYLYGGPFLLLPSSLFFVVGVMIALKNIFKKEYHIFLFWILSVLFFNSALLQNINFTHRLLSLIPALMIITALGIYKAFAVVISRKFRRFFGLLIGLLIFFVSIQNIKLYFFDSIWKKTIALNNKTATTAGFYVKQFDMNNSFYFLDSPRMSWKSVPSWEYLSGEYNITDLNESAFTDGVLGIEEKKEGKVFIVLPERKNDLDLIKQTFPNCGQREFYFDDELLFFSYECIEE